jgi:predicted AAA+ superfamily ATPase
MEQIEETLKLLNPWWKDGTISSELAKPCKREIFKKLDNVLNYRQIIILSGLRRVGKTTLLYQMIMKLLSKSEKEKIVYFNFDKETKEITDVLNSFKNLTGINWEKEKIFVFFDEITKLSGWANKIKLLYDSLPNIKFFVSSSSSVSLEDEAIKNLAGRYFLINLKPLSFKEFLILKGKASLLEHVELYKDEIKKEFDKYLLRNFPEIINWDEPILIKDYLRTTIIDKIIRSDLPEKFKNINKELLFTLLNLFYTEPGIYIDYDELSRKLKVSKRTLITHVFYLEFSYLIRKIKNFRIRPLSSSKKLQRVYSYWWTLDFCYGDNFDRIMENVIASHFDINAYWRKEGKEIDFIFIGKEKDIIPIEVKNKKELLNDDLKNMKYFLEKYHIKEGIMACNGEENTLNFEKYKIKIIPLWKLLLNFNEDFIREK